eukprot:754648-Hanusia_phi.AAC.2
MESPGVKVGGVTQSPVHEHIKLVVPEDSQNDPRRFECCIKAARLTPTTGNQGSRGHAQVANAS